MLQYDNTVAYCPKIMGIPECVDMATVSMATELGHMCMQMQFCNASINAVNDSEQREQHAKKMFSARPHTIMIVISPLLSHAFDYQHHQWLNCHLRAPPCGCLFS